MTDGVVVIDKPTGWTSHDVVARIRRLAQTRRVGHAGTLDPMATGVLVVGVGRATRLLGHLQAADKEYLATIRLGESTDSDDADGEVTSVVDASTLTPECVLDAIESFVGDIQQVPSAVSAVKVDGRRSYARVRAGEPVELDPRPVRVDVFEAREIRAGGPTVDIDARVCCSTGTYVRALARDLGTALGVGGHLTMLRRTRVGTFTLVEACTVDDLESAFTLTTIGDVARRSFPCFELDESRAAQVRHGRVLSGVDLPAPGAVAMFGPDGTFLALYEQHGSDARAVAVFV